jgi:hypothetical protein
MDDLGSLVVGPAHEIGLWQGPTRRAWLLRIAHGAGFGRQWELNQLPAEPASGSDPSRSEPTDHSVAPVTNEVVPENSFRMWWLPSARDI